MTDEAPRLTRRVLVVACGRAASTASIFAVNAVLARTWEPAEFGLFCAIWVLGNTLVPVFLLGLPTGLLYFLPRRAAAARGALVWQAALCLAGSGAALVLVLRAGGPWLASLFGLDSGVSQPLLNAGLIAFLPYVFAMVAGGYADSVLVAAGKVTWQAGLSAAVAAATVTAAVVGRAAGWSLPDVLLAISMAGVLRLVAGAGLVILALPGHGPHRTWHGLGEVLGYSWTIGLTDAAGSLSRAVDRLVVLGLFSAEVFGLYHVGAIEVPVSLVLAAAAAVLVPEVSRLQAEGRPAEIAALWRRAAARLALVILPLFAFLLAFSGPIIALYLPAGYGRSQWVFGIFLLALPLRCAVYSPLLVGMGRASWALWGSLADLLANLGLSFALAHLLLAWRPEWAFLGPAAATVLATYGQVAVLLVLIARDLSQPLAALLPWGSMLRRLALSAAAAGVARLLVGYLPSPAAQLAAGVALCAALAAAALGRSQATRREAADLLRAAFSSRPA